MPASPELIAFVSETAGRSRLQLTGRSMQPLLRSGMVVEIEPLATPPRPGAILVYRAAGKLVAHRLQRRGRSVYVTCGDAHPERVERISPQAVLGRVTAVWSSAEESARRVDGPVFQAAGLAMVMSRPLRAAYRFVAERLAAPVASPSAAAPPAAFRALVEATRRFEAEAWAAGVATLRQVPVDALLPLVKRHHGSGLVSRWLDRAAAAGVEVPAELREPFKRVRWTNALQADRVLDRARDVAGRLAGAGVEAIFLKGAARLAADEPDANLQFSGDVDVLVPAHAIERAVAALRAGGYGEIDAAERVAFFERRVHHRAPLYQAGRGVPVEVHAALSPPGSVSQQLTYEDLAPATRGVSGPAGDVRVLDGVAGAVHLAYHARDFQVWRDVVLLSRKLRGFSPAERERFGDLVRRERRDGVRLRAVAAVAAALAGSEAIFDPSAERYASWAIAREDMPLILRRRSHVVDAVVARCPRYYAGLWAVRRQARGWLYNALLTPAVVRFYWWSERARGPGVALLQATAAVRDAA